MKTLLKLLSLVVLIAVAALGCKKPEPGAPKLSVSDNLLSIDKDGGILTIDVESNRKWSISASPAGTWYQIAPSGGGENNGRITVTVLSNPGAERKVTLTISTSGNLSEQVVITQAGDGETPPEGDGTEGNPFSVTHVLGLFAPNPPGGSNGWVKGYIVGGVKTTLTDGGNAIVSANDVVFGTTGIRNTAVLIAASPSETDYTKVLVVELGLPANGFPEGFRTAVNLVDNPTNLGKELAVIGNFTRYFAVPGIRGITDYKFDGGITPPPADPDPVPALAEDFESFIAGNSDVYMSAQTNGRGWIGARVQGTLEPDVREFQGNKFVHFSAHRNSITNPITQEFWLISPRLDLDAATLKTLSFDVAAGYYNANTVFEVYILDSENPATANKTKLTYQEIADIPANAYSDWASSGSIDLSAFSGIKRIGFYYRGTSGSGNSTTYRIDNFVFGNAGISTLTVNPTSLSFVASTEQKTVAVTSNTTWTASSSADWCTVTPTSGDGNGTLTVTVTENTGSTRHASITVATTNGAVSRTITVSQGGVTSGSSVATFDFTSVMAGTSIAATSGTGTINRSTKGSNGDISVTPSNNTIWGSFGTNDAPAYWLITIPNVSQAVSRVNLSYETYGTAKSPRKWTVEVSKDNVTWESGDTYTLPSTATAANNAEDKEVGASFATPTTAGSTIYIRILPDVTDPSIDGTTVGASNVNNRLMNSLEVSVE
ncbi:MAG: BACON domain-containing protein [Bacteroidales bacterium]|nr:BACON domain-containing protein [Bacteroidales bacterium]